MNAPAPGLTAWGVGVSVAGIRFEFGGFKGLVRLVVILAIDGFHNAEDLEDFI